MREFITLLEAAELMAGSPQATQTIPLWLAMLKNEADALGAIKTRHSASHLLPGGISYVLLAEEWLIHRQAFEHWRRKYQPQATSAPAPETAEQRQARRYQMCIDAGLKMPSNTYAALPRGISQLAKREDITRQAFTEDIKAHLAKVLRGNGA